MAVLDWHSHYVVSWELEQTLELGFVLGAMGQALQLATPEICNSDQGSQFTSPQWAALLQEAGVSISMDGEGRATDGQYLRGAAVADGEVRGSISARLWQPAGGAAGVVPVL